MRINFKCIAGFLLSIGIVALVFGCAASPPPQQQSVQRPAPQQQQSANQTPTQQQQAPRQQQTAPQQQQVQQPSSQFWTGNGGRGMRLGILVPQSQGLNENQEYLPAMVQGILVSNISQYSAISVLDRVSLDRVINETLDPTYEDGWDIVRLGQVAQVGYMLTGRVIRTSTGFSLHFTVTDTTPAANVTASFSGTCTVAELDNHSAIHRASLELLSQMGVQLTARARNELGRASTQESIQAQTALARGVTAERHGFEVAALSYYLQASELDPRLAEAEKRFSIVSAAVTSGNMSGGVQNDMQWRNQWMDRLRETEEFLVQFRRDSPAFYLVYGASADRWHIEYEGTTITLGVEFYVLPEPLWFEAKNRLTTTIRNGLLATGRAENWRLNWPANSITRPSPFADASNTYPIVAEILNARGTVIARQTLNLRFGWFIHNGMEQQGTVMPYINLGTRVLFPGVDQNAVTGDLSIRISTINGAPAVNASQLGIRVLPDHEYNNLSSIRNNAMQIDNLRQYTITFDGNRNLLRGYSGSNTSIDIPWGPTVLDAGRGGSGLQNRGLISVTLPSSVLIIGDDALSQNRLTSIIIPDSVRSFGRISGNQLTSISVGSNITLSGGFGRWATDVLGESSGDSDTERFNNAYRNNNNRAGTYTRPNASSMVWTFRGQ